MRLILSHVAEYGSNVPCYKPLKALITPSKTGGKNSLTFAKRGYFSLGMPTGASPIPIPCGRCTGCRLERSRQWAIRLMKEFKLHDRSSFLTLTYHPDHTPRLSNGRPTLVLEDIQLFLKKIRRHFSPHPLRFFQCGEYGCDNPNCGNPYCKHTALPHHHVILFGEDFCKDRYRIEDTRTGFPQWMSPLLTEKWGLGRATISEVSFESAAYVARYALKKITGKPSAKHYGGRKPEFVTMSRRPGIASGYFDEFKNDLYPHDEIIPDVGRPASLPPRYFDKLLEKVDPVLYQQVKKNRAEENLDYFSDPNSTDTRLATRERVKKALIKTCLKRDLK